MAEKKKYERKKYVKTNITAKAPTEEIRNYFIDSLIEMNEYLKERELNKQIRDKAKEKIRIDRVKARSNVCNIGLRALKDRQLEEYERELTELKRGLMLNSETDDIIEISPDKITEIEDMEFKFEKLRDSKVSDNGN